MGFKTSMIIVKNPSKAIGDEELLQLLGFTDIHFSRDTTFEECMYPNDKSLNIGYYNDCLIISDDYQLTTLLEVSNTPECLSTYEKALADLFPATEILTVACHSGTNYHLYSLVRDGEKLRFKKVAHGEPIVEYGDRIEEEEAVYVFSRDIDGQLMFSNTYNDDNVYDNTEDQMMEDFAFGVAKRHLGIMISTGEDEELMFETLFRKYTASKTKKRWSSAEQPSFETRPASSSWFSRLFKKS